MNATMFPRYPPGESLSRKKSMIPASTISIEIQSKSVVFSFKMRPPNIAGYIGAVYWMIIAFAAVVSFVATTNSITVTAKHIMAKIFVELKQKSSLFLSRNINSIIDAIPLRMPAIPNGFQLISFTRNPLVLQKIAVSKNKMIPFDLVFIFLPKIPFL